MLMFLGLVPERAGEEQEVHQQEPERGRSVPLPRADRCQHCFLCFLHQLSRYVPSALVAGWSTIISSVWLAHSLGKTSALLPFIKLVSQACYGATYCTITQIVGTHPTVIVSQIVLPIHHRPKWPKNRNYLLVVVSWYEHQCIKLTNFAINYKLLRQAENRLTYFADLFLFAENEIESTQPCFTPPTQV